MYKRHPDRARVDVGMILNNTRSKPRDSDSKQLACVITYVERQDEKNTPLHICVFIRNNTGNKNTVMCYRQHLRVGTRSAHGETKWTHFTRKNAHLKTLNPSMLPCYYTNIEIKFQINFTKKNREI